MSGITRVNKLDLIPLSEFGKGIFNTAINCADPLDEKMEIQFRKSIGIPTSIAAKKPQPDQSEALFNEEMLRTELTFMKDKQLEGLSTEMGEKPAGFDDKFIIRPVLAKNGGHKKQKTKETRSKIDEEEGPEVISNCHKTTYNYKPMRRTTSVNQPIKPPGFNLHYEPYETRSVDMLDEFDRIFDEFKFRHGFADDDPQKIAKTIKSTGKKGKKIEIL